MEALRKPKRRKERLRRQFQREKAEWEYPGSQKKVKKPFQGIKEGEEMLEDRLEIEGRLQDVGDGCADLAERERSRAVLQDCMRRCWSVGFQLMLRLPFPSS